MDIRAASTYTGRVAETATEEGHMLSFDRMLSSKLILWVYWAGLLLVGGSTAVALLSSLAKFDREPLAGLGGLVFTLVLAGVAILLWRLVCESAILMFGMYDRLGEIRDLLASAGSGASPSPSRAATTVAVPVGGEPTVRAPAAEVREPESVATRPAPADAPANAPADRATPPPAIPRPAPPKAPPPTMAFRPSIGARGLTTRSLAPAGFADFGGGRTVRVVSCAGEIPPGVAIEVVGQEDDHVVVRDVPV